MRNFRSTLFPSYPNPKHCPVTALSHYHITLLLLPYYPILGSGAGDDTGVRQHGVPACGGRLLLDPDQRQTGVPDAGTLPSQGAPEGAQEISSSRPGKVSTRVNSGVPGSQSGRAGDYLPPKSGEPLWAVAAPALRD